MIEVLSFMIENSDVLYKYIASANEAHKKNSCSFKANVGLGKTKIAQSMASKKQNVST